MLSKNKFLVLHRYFDIIKLLKNVLEILKHFILCAKFFQRKCQRGSISKKYYNYSKGALSKIDINVLSYFFVARAHL
jgi:hypothetical protein